jgi:hypothetical protein
MEVFMNINPDASLVFATAAWHYTHHVLPGMRSHRGPILTVANWSGEWPGLVGLLNLNGSLVKAGVPFSMLWSKDFSDDFFLRGVREWIATRTVIQGLSHVQTLGPGVLPAGAIQTAAPIAAFVQKQKAILGVFDEGCMGIYNAIIDDELLNRCGVYKERLSQSALVARMRSTADAEALAVRNWLYERGVRFVTGKSESTDLTDAQILQQCKMYIAAMRMADEFGCDAISIQYQQGPKDMTSASDLVEGLLNNPDRPPVYHEQTGRELYSSRCLPHFNEVDECAGMDALITNRCWTALGFDPSTTLHDVRWGEHSTELDAFVWVLQISGAAPASHFAGGYGGATSERQPPMYFPLGGGTTQASGPCRRDRLEPGSRRSRQSSNRSRARLRCRVLSRGSAAALESNDLSVAIGQRRVSWHIAKRFDGTSSCQPCQHCVRPG